MPLVVQSDKCIGGVAGYTHWGCQDEGDSQEGAGKGFVLTGSGLGRGGVSQQWRETGDGS